MSGMPRTSSTPLKLAGYAVEFMDTVLSLKIRRVLPWEDWVTERKLFPYETPLRALGFTDELDVYRHLDGAPPHILKRGVIVKQHDLQTDPIAKEQTND